MAISIKWQRYRGRDLNVISGSFVAGLTPCAPAKAFSLCAPAGPSAIVGVVERWQDYARHYGGVVGHFKSLTTIAFPSGFNTRGSGFRGNWPLAVDRHTRVGTLIRNGGHKAAFACSRTT